MAQEYRENLRLALDTLLSHKLRSFLTMLGVVMGVGVLMLVAALLTGFNQSVVETITSFGADTASVSRFSQGPQFGGPRPKEERLRKPLTFEDAEALSTCCASIKAVTVWITQWERVHELRYQGNEVDAIDLRGTLPNYPMVYANAAMREGRYFTEAENIHRDDVAVLGRDAAAALFGPLPAIGKDVQIDGSTLEVIGVLERPNGNFGFDDEDRRVLIPYQTFRKIYPAAYENAFRLEGREGQLDAAVDDAREVLRRRRKVPYAKPDNFLIQTAQQQVAQFHAIVGMVAVAMVVLSLDRPADRRRRRHEYHAGQRHRAHAGDRCAQSYWRPGSRHHLAIPRRGHGAHRRGRHLRHFADRGHRSSRSLRDLDESGGAHMGYILRSRRVARHRTGFWSLARRQSRAA